MMGRPVQLRVIERIRVMKRAGVKNVDIARVLKKSPQSISYFIRRYIKK